MTPGKPSALEDNIGMKLVARVVVGDDEVPVKPVFVAPEFDDTVAFGPGTIKVDVMPTVEVVHVVVVEVEVEVMIGL